jgi:hypothetical protein
MILCRIAQKKKGLPGRRPQTLGNPLEIHGMVLMK